MDSAEVPPTIDKESFAEFVVSFSETALILFSAGSVIDTLASVIDLAVATIEGCDFAGLFLVDDDVVTTPVHTDPIVVEVDALQQLTGEGPCLDAIAQRAVFSSDDLETELRWIHFAPQATRLGIRSVLALPLTANSQLGALTPDRQPSRRARQSRDHRRSDGDSHGARADHRRSGLRRTASSLPVPQYQAQRSGPELGRDR